MAKWQIDAMLDAALDYVGNNANLICLCSAQPANRTEAVTTYHLGNVACNSADFTKANGDTSGRKITIAAKSIANIAANGNANHVALVDAANLLYVTTCNTQAVTTPNPANIGSWKIEIADAS